MAPTSAPTTAPSSTTSPLVSDQTELFAAKQWRPILFTEAAIAADRDLRESTISE